MFTPPVVKPREPDIFDEIDEFMAHSRPTPLPDGRLVPEHQAKRLASCGKRHWTQRETTGAWHSFTYCCDIYRLCPRCAQVRADKEQERIEAALGSHGLMLTVSREEEAALARKFNAQGVAYRRYVQDGETLFLHGSPALGGEEVALSSLNWNGLTQPPPGKNVSGKLGAGEEVVVNEERGETVTIKRESIEIVPPHPNWSEDQMAADIQDAQELSILKTAHLDPDGETLQRALDTRMDDFKLHLQDKGYHVGFHVCKQVQVPIDEIDWTAHNEHIREIRKTPEGMVFKTELQARIWHETWKGSGKSNGS